jgi:hypothetical protein
MATTTPNYGWPVPTSTDFVKDGATAIEALGDAIDATVYALPAGGLTLISSTAFSAVASVNITSCFSAAYTNYKVLFYQTHQPTANREVTLQLLATTTPATTAYYQAMNGINQAGSTSTSLRNNGSDIVGTQIWDSTADMSAFDMTIFKPFLANRTSFTLTNMTVTSGSYIGQAGGALHSAQTSYDGFSLSTSGTNFGGVVKVYGIQD